MVQEYVLAAPADASSRTPSRWELRRDHIRIGDKKVFAPANLRAATENQEYAKLVQHWLQSKYTLRYTGGMVPDVHHITMVSSSVMCAGANRVSSSNEHHQTLLKPLCHRAAEYFATPAQPRPQPSCGCCMRRHPWPSLLKQPVVLHTTAPALFWTAK